MGALDAAAIHVYVERPSYDRRVACGGYKSASSRKDYWKISGNHTVCLMPDLCSLRQRAARRAQRGNLPRESRGAQRGFILPEALVQTGTGGGNCTSGGNGTVRRWNLTAASTGVSARLRMTPPLGPRHLTPCDYPMTLLDRLGFDHTTRGAVFGATSL